MRVVIGYGHDDDDRYVYQFEPARGFSSAGIACPDLSGVQLAFDGEHLWLAQAHNRRLLELAPDGSVVQSVTLEYVPVGLTVVHGQYYAIVCLREFEEPHLAELTLTSATADVRLIAPIPFGARALAFDGERFWTADRRKNDIVAFAIVPQR